MASVGQTNLADGEMQHPQLRNVPLPKHLSEDARRALSVPPRAAPVFPALKDKDGWRNFALALNERYSAGLGDRLRSRLARVTRTVLSGVPAFTCQPTATEHPGRICLSVHGGAFVGGGGDHVAFDALRCSTITGLQTFAIDYRLPPDDPYPAAPEDVLRAYRYLIESWRAEDIIVSGISAGGNVAAAMVLRARDQGLPLPAGLILVSPALDLTESGDSFEVLLGLDNVLPVSLMPMNEVYANGADLADPYISPLFADFTPGFPPTFLQAGTRDLFLSNAVRMHRALRRAGLQAELHIWDAMPHGGFGGVTREDREVSDEIRRFVASRLGR